MKKIISAIAFIFLSAFSFAQSIGKITLAQSGSIEAIGIDLGGNVTLNIKEDGSISNWGFDLFKSRGMENYADKLESYVGRVEYYPQESDPAFRGKVKYIGSTAISYYASYDKEIFRGKIKSIGSNNFEYYAEYDDKAVAGKIKNIGAVAFSWYASFDNEGSRGKIKSVGNTNISFYSSFDDKAYKGRIKSIDSNVFTYYSSYDRQEYRGAMKTGTQVQVINSIKYFVK